MTFVTFAMVAVAVGEENAQIIQILVVLGIVCHRLDKRILHLLLGHAKVGIDGHFTEKLPLSVAHGKHRHLLLGVAQVVVGVGGIIVLLLNQLKLSYKSHHYPNNPPLSPQTCLPPGDKSRSRSVRLAKSPSHAYS